MKLVIRNTSIKLMLDIIRDLKANKDVSKRLDRILEHEDYEFEFKRHKDRVTKEEFKNYLLNCRNLKEEDIQNKDLKVHHKYYLDVFENIDFYYQKLDELKTLVTQELLEKSLEVTKKGLPDGFSVNQIGFVFTLGIGMSFGYVFGDATHYDFLKLSKEIKFKDFLSTLSHEAHHVCMNHIYADEYTPQELFIIYFSGEGLAVKYCNNAEGVISKKIYEGEPNVGLDKFTWDYLNKRFYQAFDRFKEVLNDIKSGKIDTVEKVTKVITSDFMNSYIEGQDKSEKPKLMQFLLYSLGNDLYGVIHDVFGKDKVFEVIKNPKMFIQTFNDAVRAIDRADLQIEI